MIDVVIQDLAVFTQKVRGLVELISQVRGLFFEAGEVNSGHLFIC
jgi:hypothetical protein